MSRARLGATALLVVAFGGSLSAQDTIPPVDQGVRIGITYTPGVRPGMLVLGGAATPFLDSVRAILERDLDYSDRFEMISLPGGDSLTLGVSWDPAGQGDNPPAAPFVNYSLYRALGAEFAVGRCSPVGIPRCSW